MSTINSTTFQAATGSATQVKPEQQQSSAMQLSPDDLFKVFLKQLTTQNPMNPSESSTILQQMADISAISASDQTQQTLKEVQQNISTSLGNTNLITATGMIGKKVEVPSGVSTLVAGDGLAGSVMMTTPGDNIKVTIRDNNNQVVNEVSLGSTSSPGLVEFNWNGRKPDGSLCDPGYYHISATATVNGKQQPVDTAGAFQIKSVATNQSTGDLILNVDGLGGMGLKDIIKVL